jgi:hypothetical protein
MNMEINKEHCGHRMAHFSWAAIFVGALVGVGLGFLLNLFSMAIGLSAYSATSDGASVIALGGLIGVLIGVIASMGAAGFVTGHIARFHHHYCGGGVVYGFVTWSVALMLSAILLMPLSHYVAFSEDNLNPSAMKMEVASSHKATVKSTSTAVEKNKMMNAASKQVTPTDLAWSGWVIFALFFVGALSSCIGACCGMGCKKDMEDQRCHTR